jgi:hypothetical protein
MDLYVAAFVPRMSKATEEHEAGGVICLPERDGGDADRDAAMRSDVMRASRRRVGGVR